MLVGVAVIKCQARRMKCLKLGSYLGGQLPARLGAAGEQASQRNHVRSKRSVFINQQRYCAARERWLSLHQHYMQANPQSRHPAGTHHRIITRRCRNHQARSRENSLPMSDLDGFIDLRSGTEIIGGDNQSSQAASRLVRRKLKNSTPSRKRRFIISGLAIIYASIEAILDGRK
jgi:hypothetical protein